MRSKDCISIVLPTNRWNENLIRAIKSVLSQSYHNFEFIIVVNGPSRNIISSRLTDNFSDSRIRIVLVNTSYINFSLAYGVDIARGEFIVRMDSDDIMFPTRIEEQLSFLKSNSDYAIVGSYVELLKGGLSMGMRKYPVADRQIKQSLYFSNPFCHPATMIRRSVLLEIGSYQGGLMAEDYDLYLRLCNHSEGLKFHNLPRALLGYNIDDGEAKRSRKAYVSMLSSQVFQFFSTKDILWALAIVVSIVKILFRARKG